LKFFKSILSFNFQESIAQLEHENLMFKKLNDSIIANSAIEQTESLQKMLEEKNQLIEQLQNQLQKKPSKSSSLNVRSSFVC